MNPAHTLQSYILTPILFYPWASLWPLSFWLFYKKCENTIFAPMRATRRAHPTVHDFTISDKRSNKANVSVCFIQE
jgi:hypothetical protein